MSRLAAGAASAVVGALLGVAVLIVLDQPPVQPEVIAPIAAAATEAPSDPAAPVTPARVSSDTATDAAAEPAPPARVVIPSIDVDADVAGVGLNADQSMEVPDFGEAGWYTPGPRPGAVGPAVIAAHVDSVDGPDVFYRLKELNAGDEIIVEHADGASSTFVVQRSEQQRKEDLPVERIWNTTDQAVLRLITCGGDFNAQRRSYGSNVIVYATAASA
ncbi:MAG: class F sortase [Actinobacteria bacterium]|nr:class F sortase [Actinomycetota bacterium]